MIEASTDRLLLRQWRDSDLPFFARLNANPEVMRYFPSTLNQEKSDDLANRIRQKMERFGWGFWALERQHDGQFLGFVGLNDPDYSVPVSPCTEIGWRLDQPYWGFGYASEAAKKCLEIAFTTLNRQRIHSFTAIPNMRSQAVMTRIGMTNAHNNFMHPWSRWIIHCANTSFL